MNIQKIHKLFLVSNSVSIDSRNIKPNDVFFAIKGLNFDGNKFAVQAIENGASHVISDDLEISKISDKIIYVNDSVQTLQELANFHRKFINTKIIAITGSNGKTTSKELIFSVLKSRYKTIATKGNLNNHLGVPLTILSMNKETEIGIVEMGANHLREIDFLCNIAEPDFGYITNFGNAHLEGFKSLEGVIIGKSELYTYLKDNDKVIFYNSENSKQSSILNNYSNSFSFGSNSKSNCILNKLKSKNCISIKYNEESIVSNIYGDYNFENISIAIAIGCYFKIGVEQIKKGVESYLPENNRSQILKKRNNTIILDAYNANPSSMDLAISSFENINTTNKMIIAGDMFELGQESNKYHQQIINYLEKSTNTLTYVVGVNFCKTNHSKKIKSFPSTKELINNISKLNISNYSILIKGSRTMQLEKIVEFI
ncbi:MAG: UDP-N-acetylmuramoyl-tripeptide--D-alanyl-D-alanine ligase [Flavobacteriaceae bacterium]|nr:MAG: UDP-N-acetylmuramoyl-tripeptide--D-alanyl-D-alanine ligase [Flavobacteriaceae bacterium]